MILTFRTSLHQLGIFVTIDAVFKSLLQEVFGRLRTNNLMGRAISRRGCCATAPFVAERELHGKLVAFHEKLALLYYVGWNPPHYFTEGADFSRSRFRKSSGFNRVFLFGVDGGVSGRRVKQRLLVGVGFERIALVEQLRTFLNHNRHIRPFGIS